MLSKKIKSTVHNPQPMSKPISKNLHGLIDYSYALAVPLLLGIAGFKREESARLMYGSLCADALSYSLLIKADWGWLPDDAL
jgi:hypothetical protein